MIEKKILPNISIMSGFFQSNFKSGNVLANNLRVQQNINITGEINPENSERLLSVVGNAAVTNNLQVYGNLTVDGSITKLPDGTFDVIVIGAGAAGATCAKKISDDSSVKVLLLEMGQNLNDDPIVKYPFGVTDGKLNLFITSVHYADNIMTSDPQGGPVSNDDRWIWNYQAGKARGGATVHNYLESNKTSPGFQTYMASRAGAYASLWDANAAYTIYQQMEHYYGSPAQPNRGYTGPMPSIPGAPVNAFGEHYLEAVGASSNVAADNALVATGDGDALYFNNKVDLALQKQQDYYLFPDFTRAHTGVVFLGPDVISSNGVGIAPRQLKLIEGAMVDHIEFDTSGITPVAKRVHIFKNGKCYVYEATKKIILSAGGMRSPGILERSGVGDPALLQSLGIPVVFANSNVGEGLTNGSGPGLLSEVAPSAFVPGQGIPFKIQMDASLPYDPAWTRRIQGAATGGTFPVFEPYNAMLKAYGLNTDGENNYFEYGFNNQPTSIGSIHITDCIPGSQPKFIQNNPTSDEDIRINCEYYKLMKRVEAYMTTNYPADGYTIKYPPPAAYAGYPGAPTNVFTGSISGTTLTITGVTSGAIELGCTINGFGVATNTRVSEFVSGSGGVGTYEVTKSQTVGSTTINSDTLALFAASFVLNLYHASSTCKMGDLLTQDGVVDGQLHVYGTENLMVVDASISPITYDSGQLGAMMIGWQGANICLSTI